MRSVDPSALQYDQQQENSPLQQQNNSSEHCSCEKDFRSELQKRLLSNSSGLYLEKVLSFLALASSIVNVILSYYQDMKHKDILNTYNLIDLIVCAVFLFYYVLKLYVAQHRFQHFTLLQSVIDLLIIVPVIAFYDYHGKTKMFGFVWFSRYLRIVNFGIMLSKSSKIGSTDVDRQISVILITMILLVYISSGIFTVILNI